MVMWALGHVSMHTVKMNWRPGNTCVSIQVSWLRFKDHLVTDESFTFVGMNNSVFSIIYV